MSCSYDTEPSTKVAKLSIQDDESTFPSLLRATKVDDSSYENMELARKAIPGLINLIYFNGKS